MIGHLTRQGVSPTWLCDPAEPLTNRVIDQPDAGRGMELAVGDEPDGDGDVREVRQDLAEAFISKYDDSLGYHDDKRHASLS